MPHHIDVRRRLSRRVQRILALLTVMTFAVTSGWASPAFATVAGTSHSLPGNSVNGVTRLCGPDPAYGCTSGGYAGQNSGWPGAKYGAGYASSNSYGYHNCTLYAAYRLAGNGVPNPGWSANASGWATAAASAGTPVNQTPAVGAIAQWNTGYGHVAYVETVTSSYIEISADNYGYNYTDRFRISTTSPAWPDNFLHFADQPPAPANGSFASVQENGQVYRIAGGAPIYVTTWDIFGGPPPTTSITLAQLNALPQYPADGTLVTGGQTGQVYRIAGGAPIYVSTWAPFGGPQPTTVIDQVAIDNAGAGGLWNHLSYRPADGTFVTGGQTGQMYRIAGGAPTYLTTWDIFGGPPASTVIDQVAIDNAGAGGLWNHLNYRPADGTFITAGQTGQVYRIAGGAPIYVSSWTPFGGPQTTVVIDQQAINNAGAGGTNNLWNHLNYRPANNTWITSSQLSTTYRVTDGYAYLMTMPPGTAATAVDQAALTNAGAGGANNLWNHLKGLR